MLDWVRRVAQGTLPVLVRGETGSGKEGVARAVHDGGPRRAGPFVAVNCTALAESLLEAELFGSVRGAYTGAERDRSGLFRRAHGGTLFLDEIGEMSPPMQAKLLRVLEDRRIRPVGGEREVEVDVRVVSATHRDLHAALRSGTFREDLYHRIAVLEVRVPPLRERPDDLPRLVAELGQRLARETGASRLELAPDAWAALQFHTWPGNVRELHAVLARGLLRAAGQVVRASHLGLGQAAESCAAPLERVMVRQALCFSDGNLTRAAERIGWTRQKLYRRMRALNLERPAS